MSWTEERTAILTKMWEDGATASQIAEELGEVSRNAVIGKAHRMGLKARPSPVKTSDAKAKAKSAAKAGAKSATPPSTPAAPSVTQEAAPARPAVAAPRPAPAPAPAPTPAPAAREAATGDDAQANSPAPSSSPSSPKIVSVGPGGFLRQGPGDQQPPIPPAPPRRLVPAKPNADVVEKTSLLDLSEKVCRWPMGHPGEPDFHFCGEPVNPGFPYCVEHCGRAYQAQLPRGARRPPPPLPFGGPRVR